MKRLKQEWVNYKLLLSSIPALCVAFFCVSVILMNLLANREIATSSRWFALDCGLFASWLSFLSMDMITKRFGARASIEISLTALLMNLICCVVFWLVLKLPGNWGMFYEYPSADTNIVLDSTFVGTWYVLLGSSVAFIVSSIVNSVLNERIGKLFNQTSFKEYSIRSYVSTFIGQFVDNLVFATIVSHVFFGWNWAQVIVCSLIGGTFELICEIVFSPIGYRVCKKWEENNIGTTYLKAVNR